MWKNSLELKIGVLDMKKYLSKFLLTACLLLVSACATSSNYNTAENNSNVLSIFLVRHAEKTKERPDPDLTDAGKNRSLELAVVLKDKNITTVHSSDYLRTRETARPTADAFGLEIELYDAGDLEAIANKLKAASGTHLVVGHSNTTPQLVTLLGGDPVSEIYEASEYDRLYIINFTQDGTVQSELLRYGSLFIE